MVFILRNVIRNVPKIAEQHADKKLELVTLVVKMISGVEIVTETAATGARINVNNLTGAAGLVNLDTEAWTVR